MPSRAPLALLFTVSVVLFVVWLCIYMLRSSGVESPVFSFPAFQYNESEDGSTIEISGEFRYEGAIQFSDIQHHIIRCQKVENMCTHSVGSVGWKDEQVELNHILYSNPVYEWGDDAIIFLNEGSRCTKFAFRLDKKLNEVRVLARMVRTPECSAYKDYDDSFVIELKQYSPQGK